MNRKTTGDLRAQEMAEDPSNKHRNSEQFFAKQSLPFMILFVFILVMCSLPRVQMEWPSISAKWKAINE